MAFLFEDLRDEYEQTKAACKDGMEKAFLFLEMALVNYQQTMEQMETEEEQQGRDEDAIFIESQNLSKEEGRKRARKMKDLRSKKTFEKEKNMMQSKYNDNKQEKKGTQQRRDPSKVEVRRRRGGRKIWWGKKERGKAEKSLKALKLDGRRGIFFRDKG